MGRQMTFKTGMTTEEWVKAAKEERKKEISRLRGLANYYERLAKELELKDGE